MEQVKLIQKPIENKRSILYRKMHDDIYNMHQFNHNNLFENFCDKMINKEVYYFIKTELQRIIEQQVFNAGMMNIYSMRKIFKHYIK